MKQRRRLNTSSPRKTPVIAAVTSVALVAAGAFGSTDILKTQDVGGKDIEVSTSTASLSDGTSVVVDDPAVATQGEGEAARTVKEFTRDEPFSVFGLTWEGERDVAAYVRSKRADGTWSEWYHMDQTDTPGERQGTEPIYVEKTNTVQISTANVDLVENGEVHVPGETVSDQADIPLPDSEPIDLPTLPGENAPSAIGDGPEEDTESPEIAPVADIEDTADAPAEGDPENKVTSAKDLEAVFVDGGEGTVDGAIAPAQANANGMPRVISRASWGAKPARGTNYTEPTIAITVHHTSGSNNYSAAEAPGIMRSMQAYHQGMGWQDLGYHAVVDKYGNIYEGRAGGLDRGPQGAHVGGFNNQTWGVSMIGDYMKASPSPEALRAMGEIIGWRAAVSNFDPTGTVYLRSDYSYRGTKYPAGAGANFPRINAHRDFHYNDCPGDNLYSQLGTVRNHAKAKYDQIKGGGAASAPKESTTPESNSGNSGTDSNSGTVPSTQPGGTSMRVNNLAEISSQISFEGILSGDPAAIAAAVGTVAGALLVSLAGAGMIPSQVKNIANVEILPGVTLSSIRPEVNKIVAKTGNTEVKEAWSKIEPTLGKLEGVIAGVGGDEYGFFEKGIALLSSDGNQVIMPEQIANAWLKQGMDLGPLGKPVKSDSAANNGDIRVDFEKGNIFYDAKTNTVDINLDK